LRKDPESHAVRAAKVFLASRGPVVIDAVHGSLVFGLLVLPLALVGTAQ
jgi:hypothetical protein